MAAFFPLPPFLALPQAKGPPFLYREVGCLQFGCDCHSRLRFPLTRPGFSEFRLRSPLVVRCHPLISLLITIPFLYLFPMRSWPGPLAGLKRHFSDFSFFFLLLHPFSPLPLGDGFRFTLLVFGGPPWGGGALQAYLAFFLNRFYFFFFSLHVFPTTVISSFGRT